MRICPQCDHRGPERRCPVDGLPTVDEELLQEHAGAPSLVGKVFEDRYRVTDLIGKGATGWVFRALHLRMGSDVALKVLRSELGADIRQIRRFYREARASSQLKSPHSIDVHDFGATDEGDLYIAMEYLDGQGLDRLLASTGPLPPARAIHIARQVCEALDDAHEIGVVHRDLKPENIFICERHRRADFVKVLDFGLSKFLSGPESQQGLTRVGWIIGTPLYIAPEQACSRPTDRRTDLYSLGVMLFEMIVGHVPFRAESAEQLLRLHVSAAPPPVPMRVGRHAIPQALRSLVADLLAKDPARRPASAAMVDRRLAAIERLIANEPTEIPGATSDTALPPLPGESTEALPVEAAEIVELVPAGWRPDDSSLMQTGPRGASSSLGAGESFERPRRRASSFGAIAAGAGAIAALSVVLALRGASAPAPDASVHRDAHPAPAATSSTPRPESGPPAALAAPREAGAATPIPGGNPPAEPAAADTAAAALDPGVVAPAPASAPAPAATVSNSIALTTIPPGAVVTEGDHVLGTTPLSVAVARDAPRLLQIDMPGFVTTFTPLDTSSGDAVTVALDPEAAVLLDAAESDDDEADEVTTKKQKKDKKKKKDFAIRLL